MKKQTGFSAYVSTPLSVATGFLLAILFFAFVLKDIAPAIIISIFLIVQCGSMLAYGLLPPQHKRKARMTAMWIMGLFLLVMAGLLGRNSFQLENFWLYLFAGAMGGVIVHFSIAKIIGPIFLGRTWCGWGCWTTMVLDLLPFKSDIHWASLKTPRLRLLHFILSFTLVVVVVGVLGIAVIDVSPKAQAEGMGTQAEFWWLLIGNLMYYLSGIILAFWLKDNRAFCKYLCPVTVFLRFTSRFSVLRIRGNAARCAHCATCSQSCPMGIDVHAYIKAGERVKSTECIMCMKCITACPEANLRSSIGLDIATKDCLRQK